MHAFNLGLAATAIAFFASTADATVVYTALATPLTTADNTGGGNADGTGVWFNVLTGRAESRGFLFPTPVLEDGKFFLLKDVFNYAQPEAEIFTEGLFSRGNGVIYASSTNLNPARFGAGAVIGAGVGYQSPGAGYPDLGPVFGNWATGGRGFLGLTIRDPSGTSAADIFYGFADVTLNADYSITLNGFAYENLRGAAITTSFAAPVPEPTGIALAAVGLPALAVAVRRRRRPAPARA